MSLSSLPATPILHTRVCRPQYLIFEFPVFRLLDKVKDLVSHQKSDLNDVLFLSWNKMWWRNITTILQEPLYQNKRKLNMINKCTHRLTRVNNRQLVDKINNYIILIIIFLSVYNNFTRMNDTNVKFSVMVFQQVHSSFFFFFLEAW